MATSFPMYDDVTGGILLLFSNKFEIADEFFLSMKDNNPRASLHWAESMFFRSILSEDQGEQKLAIERLNHTINIATDHIKSLEKGESPKGRNEINKSNIKDFLVDTKTVLADAHTLLAGLLFLDDERFSGLLNLRKGWKIYKSVLSIVENSSEPINPLVLSNMKFGAGLFYFIISLIPPGLPQKVASLAGFKAGDNFKATGLQYLRDVFASGSIRSDLAGIVLASHNILLTAENDPATIKTMMAEADLIVKDGLAKNPKGSIFQALASIYQLELYQPKLALEFIDKSINNCKHITTYPALLLRLKSVCLAMDYDWRPCAELLTEILTKSQELLKKKKKSAYPWAMIYNTLRCGACYIMLQENDKGKKIFEQAAAMKQNDVWTKTLGFQAKKYALNGGHFAMLEIMILTDAFDKILRGADDERKQVTLDMVETLGTRANGAKTAITKDTKVGKAKEKDMNDPLIDNRITYLTIKAMVLRSQGKFDEPRALLKEVVDANQYGFLKDKTWYALAQTELGKISTKSNPEEAKIHFQSIMKLHFSWEVNVKRRASNLMKQLGMDIKSEDFDDTTDSQIMEDEDMKRLMKEDADD